MKRILSHKRELNILTCMTYSYDIFHVYDMILQYVSHFSDVKFYETWLFTMYYIHIYCIIHNMITCENECVES